MVIRFRDNSGSMIVPMMFVALMFFLFVILMIDISRAGNVSDQTQTLADVCLLSSLRITAESLHTIAERWSEFGALMGPVNSDGTVQLPLASRAYVEKKSLELKKALPGYQGRSTAVIKVVAEANHYLKDHLFPVDNSGVKIDLVAQKLKVRYENNQTQILDSLWYQRNWNIDPESGARDLKALIMGRQEFVMKDGETLTFNRNSMGRLKWDVDLKNAYVQAHGNGGYPRSWADAVYNGRLDPNRWAYYRAVMESPEGK